MRLTVNSSRLGDAILTPKGDKLYYQAAFEGGYDLWSHDLKENKTEIVLKNVGYGSLIADKEGKNVFLCSQGNLKKIDIEKEETKPIEFEAVFNYRPYGEREYMFDHVWRAGYGQVLRARPSRCRLERLSRKLLALFALHQ